MENTRSRSPTSAPTHASKKPALRRGGGSVCALQMNPLARSHMLLVEVDSVKADLMQGGIHAGQSVCKEAKISGLVTTRNRQRGCAATACSAFTQRWAIPIPPFTLAGNLSGRQFALLQCQIGKHGRMTTYLSFTRTGEQGPVVMHIGASTATPSERTLPRACRERRRVRTCQPILWKRLVVFG